MQIFGGVVVNGIEYGDDDIASLIGTDVSTWRYGGDAFEEECGILICMPDGTDHDFGHPDPEALQKALKFIAEHR